MKNTVPSNRPVIGKDLENLRQVLGITASDACWLFGLTMQKWGELVHKKSHDPIQDPSLALLVRLVDEDPSLVEIPNYPSPESFFNFLNTIEKIDQKTFSLILGGDKSSGHRWISRGSRTSPHVMRLMHYLRKKISKDLNGASEVEKWVNVVENEAHSRNINDLWKEGRWHSDKKTGI